MAARVNTRFVLFLLIGTVVLAGGLGATYWLMRTTAAEHVQRGDAFLANGLIEEAVGHYRKAAHKDPRNVDLLLKLSTTVAAWPTDDPLVARRRSQDAQQLLMAALDAEPTNTEAFERLMSRWLDSGIQRRSAGDYQTFAEMLKRCELSLNAQPSMLVARKYRGIAQTYRMEKLELTEQQQDAARTDLEAALEADERDILAATHLARWHLQRVAVLREANRLDDAQTHLDAAVAASQKQFDLDPGNPDRALPHLRVLLTAGFTEEAEALAATLEARFLADSTDADDSVELAGLLMATDGVVDDTDPDQPVRRGLTRAMALLEDAAADHPGELRLRMQLGGLQKQLRRYDDALTTFDAVRSFNVPQAPDAVLGRDSLQQAATIEYADTLLFIAELATDGSRSARIDEASRLRDELQRQLTAEDPRLNLLAGKIAIMQRDFAVAALKLDQAVAQLKSPTHLLPALRLASRAYEQRGELGAAVERLRRYLAIYPAWHVKRDMAEILVRLKQFEQAQSVIDELALEKPHDPSVITLQAGLLRAQGRYDDALAQYRRLDATGNDALVLAITATLIDADRRDEAVRELTDAFNAAPANTMLLGALLNLTEDEAARTALLDRARDAGVDPARLEQVASFSDSPDAAAASVDARIDRMTDPFRQAVARYGVLMNAGKVQEATVQLAEAVRLRPDEPDVLNLQFEHALITRSFDDAAALLPRAAQLNTDLAQGDLMRGRLAFTQRQYAAAIQHLRAGLQRRPVYSEGWRMLGEAHRLAGDLTAAEDAFRKAVEQRPNNLAALRGLAVTLSARGNQNAALELYRQMVRQAPDDRAVLELYLEQEQRFGSPAVALRQRLELQRLRPDDMSNRRGIAMLYAGQGDFVAANRVVDELLAAAEPDIYSVNVAASVKAMAGDPQLGRQLLQQHVVGRGTDATTQDWATLARFLLRIGQLDDAVAAYRRGIAVEDADARPATRELADLLFDLRRVDDAVPLYDSLWQTATRQQDIDRVVGLRYAHALVLARQVDKARTVLAAVVKQHGETPESLGVEALVLELQLTEAMAAGNASTVQRLREEALRVLDRAIQRDPNRAITYMQKGQLLARFADQQTQAMEALRRALELNPELADARRAMAALHIQRGANADAIVELQMVLREQPNHQPTRRSLVELYFAGGELSLLGSLLEESATLYPNDAYWPRQRARLAIRQQKTADAVTQLRQAVALGSEPIDVQMLADQLIRAGSPAEALKLLDDRDAMTSGSAVLEATRGRALADLDREADARSAFRSAIRMGRSMPELSRVVDEMVLGVGEQGALELLKAQADSSAPVAMMLLTAQWQLRLKQYDDAVAMLQTVLSRVGPHETDKPNAERVTADQLLGLVEHAAGRYEKAVAAYNRVLAVVPDEAGTLNNLAYVLAEHLDDPRKALPLAEKAAKLRPESPQVLDTLGWVQFKLGQTAEAYQTLKRSTDIQPTPANCYHLGLVLVRTGQPRVARTWFEQSSELARKADDKPMQNAAAAELAKLTGQAQGQTP